MTNKSNVFKKIIVVTFDRLSFFECSYDCIPSFVVRFCSFKKYWVLSNCDMFCISLTCAQIQSTVTALVFNPVTSSWV